MAKSKLKKKQIFFVRGQLYCFNKYLVYQLFQAIKVDLKTIGVSDRVSFYYN